MKPTRKAIIALAVVMAVASVAAGHCTTLLYGEGAQVSKVIPFVSAFFVLFGTLTIITLDSLKGDGRKYMSAFMVLKGLKLFSALVGSAIYVALNREDAVPFLVIFLVFYVIYLVFEVVISQKLNKGLTK